MTEINPSLQGDLDGLCGAYSLVNVMAWIFDKRVSKRKLFQTILEEYSERWDLYDWIINGIDSQHMNYLVNKVFLNGIYHNRFPLNIYRPFIKKVDLTIGDVFNSIDAFLLRYELNDRAVLIANQEHWSVIINSTGHNIYFLDSCSAIRSKKRTYGLKGDGKRYTLCLQSIYFINSKYD